ncbi:XRE family transcriptional regulator [Thalassospira tepidiphila]|uniref:helix-turn-helix domain-containing protein n=1 Tax=Thalassospira tepidiphila TaxID=393657 RepID=UPI001BCE8FC5|nr:helix-turn-helix transcriptional regulator [Thalassospira tepidiphila]MBS8275150.1 XRE family transcriptional regulator [Thalassospira tepidiphila]
MSTQLGKALKKLRIDCEERLLDMAHKLGKSASFISAVEIGKKSPPTDFEEMVIRTYHLKGMQADDLRRAADQSRKTFTIEPRSELGRDMAGLFARRINTLPDEKMERIKEILSKD